LPLTKIVGVTKSSPGDWSHPSLAWIFSLAIFFLGLSAAVFGRWVERVGPRKTMFAAAVCFGGGFVISAFGVWWHQLWIIYLGYGLIGGCGLGLGYISPVSTLVKWFPDRPGYGDRHGYHGIWRRRLHWFESQFAAHGPFQIGD